MAYAPRVMWAGKNASVSLTLDDSDAQFTQFSVRLNLITNRRIFDTYWDRGAAGAYGRGRVHTVQKTPPPPLHL